MSDGGQGESATADLPEYDAVIVGASLAGCTTAILLGRAGAQVALVEKRPDPRAFKRVCTHYIQASAVPTLERLGLLDPIMAAGAVRTRMRTWTRWGWIDPPQGQVRYSISLRREGLDPLVREAAAATPGVELLLGRTALSLLRERGAIRGVVVGDRTEQKTELRGRLVVAADGRDSRIAELAGIAAKTLPNGRFSYSAYFEGAAPAGAPDARVWWMDPQWAAALPTDGELVHYMVMPTRDRLSEFKRDPAAALTSYLADLPDAPPIQAGRLVGPVIGKLDLQNRVRRPIGPGLALVGDAALTSDPLFGIGCGWAFQSGEWLAESVAPALHGEEPLQRGLRRYRRRRRRQLRSHASLIHSYSTGRRMRFYERRLFAAAARDSDVAAMFDALVTRRVTPTRMLARTAPRAAVVNARHALARHRDEAAETGSDRAAGTTGR